MAHGTFYSRKSLTIPFFEKFNSRPPRFYIPSRIGKNDVKNTLDQAIDETGVVHIQVKHRPRLLSDNGPCYLSRKLKIYLNEHQMTHARCAVSSHDPGQDRTLSSIHEERGETGALLLALGAGAGYRSDCTILQPGSVS